MSERKELLFRILVAIVSGIILKLWSVVVGVLIICQIVYVLLKNKRHRPMADFCNVFITQSYKYFRYICFTSDERPFPFEDIVKPLEPVEMSKKKY